MANKLAEAVTKLKHDPDRPVQVEIDGFTIEMRAVPSQQPDQLPGDLLAEIGWKGETAEELMKLLREARQRGGSRPVPTL